MAQQARTRLATTNRKNARYARSRRESPFSVSAECGRNGSCPKVTRRGGAGVSFSSAARRQKSVRVRTEKVNFLVGSRVFSAAMVVIWWEAQRVGVCCAARPRREAAPTACAGSLRLRTPFCVVRCLSGAAPGQLFGFGKEAHETVPWERPRGARPSQVVVALFLALTSLYCSSGTAR